MKGLDAGQDAQPAPIHPSQPTLAWRGFEALRTEELYSLLKLRCTAFVVEQRCAYQDIDGADRHAQHLLAGCRAPDELAGCLRLLPPGAKGDEARIGRVVVAPEARGVGLGRRLVAEALVEAHRRWGGVPITLSAQGHLVDFYGGFGFTAASEPTVDECGIVHVEMRLERARST